MKVKFKEKNGICTIYLEIFESVLSKLFSTVLGSQQNKNMQHVTHIMKEMGHG